MARPSTKAIYAQAIKSTSCERAMNDTMVYPMDHDRRFRLLSNHTRANTRQSFGMAMFYDPEKNEYTYGRRVEWDRFNNIAKKKKKTKRRLLSNSSRKGKSM